MCVSCMFLSVTLPCLVPRYLSKTLVCKGRIMSSVHCVTFDYSARIVTLNEFTRAIASSLWKPGREQKLPFERIAGFWFISISTRSGSNSWHSPCVYQPVMAVKRHERFNGSSSYEYDWVGNSWTTPEQLMDIQQRMGSTFHDHDFLPLIFHGRFGGRTRRHLRQAAAGSVTASATAAGIDVSVDQTNGNETHRFNQVRFYSDLADIAPRLRLLNECLRGRRVEDEELSPPLATDHYLPHKVASSETQEHATPNQENAAFDMAYVDSMCDYPPPQPRRLPLHQAAVACMIPY